MKKTFMLKRLAFGMVLAGMASVSQAAGFALMEQSGSGLGNAFAGQAAIAQDASTVFFNPAGMSELPDAQVVVSGTLISPSFKFSGTNSVPVGGDQGGDAGGLAFDPNMYLSMPLAHNLHFGLGINAPFGLKTQYDAGWVGRFQAIKSEVKTVNVNPSIAWQATPALSVGAGISVQYAEATLTNAISPLAAGSMMTIKGNDYGWGYNLGGLWKLNEQTRVGLAYRSEVKHTLEGTLTANAVLPSGPVTADLTLPASASLSVFHKLTQSVDVMADATWTGWSSFDKLAVQYVSLPVALPATQENWKDSWRYSVGATWHQNQTWSWRTGLAYDQTPVQDQYRTARIPDASRTWVAFGGQYRMDEKNAVDFGYSHMFMKDVSLNSASATGTLTGTYTSSVDLLAAQFTHNF